ncbi:cell division ABC transporter permease FtsX [Bacillus mycoides]|uniref:permease-like cell division protein FtsX n=1 Tax=Bacillus mycoides TaxID=1405 RepID=UPI001C030629|nr:permease-like cell division protein FtsX [Bacillus mycoides]NUC16051.1 cell division ABC transporter permease FtsX [Bacillus mycoides]QWG53097.1 cell division ABC transporter permease FtsX [Bacillus mycoides]QWG58628.1 cell division ABC transporter permease FtsX [Bacillus mycoides]QWG73556.1 cell division ABC transporter permease FtsX [Bacillus mycoides]QWH25659.1 cell division ABC transporter permease FtsX [Bacillus mycoides]
MKAKTLSRHLREGVKNLSRNGWMTFASVSAVTVTLLLVGVFLAAIMNMNHFATKVEQDVEIRVHVDPAAKEADQKKLEEDMSKIAKVDSIKYSSKEEELKRLIKSLGDSGKTFELFEQDNPLKNVFVVKAKEPTDTATIAKKIEKMQFVSNVQYGKGQVEKLFDTVKTGRNIGIALIAGLLFTAMFLISNTIKITIYARSTEIEIMKLVGATNWFIRWPFLLEGLFLGVLGSIIPIGLILVIYNSLQGVFNEKLGGTIFELLPYNPFVFQLAGLLMLIGALIGMWGSVMSIRRFLKV